jgi:ZipA, C-terminal FtsZ-binding domain
MTDLQLGLAVIGAVAVIGVLVYNRVQERSVRRQAERAFASRHADVLLGAQPARREPTLEASPRRAAAQSEAMPDPQVDYVIDLDVPRGVASAAVLDSWQPLEHRFAKRVLLAGSDGSGWRRIVAGDAGRCIALRGALQLVSRAGVVSDAELLEFRSQVETLGARIGATVSSPEMHPALEAARGLDRACADADIQIALHVLTEKVPEEGFGDQPFQVVPRKDGLTFTLDVARTLEPGRSYEAMARAARQLASAHGGRLVDDKGNALDQHALATIGAQLEAVRQELAGRGIEPGSPLALRLFS